MVQTAFAMKIQLLEYVREGLNRRKGQWRQIAARSDVPYDTLSKIARGLTVDPGVLTVQKLAAHLQELDRMDGVEVKQVAVG